MAYEASQLLDDILADYAPSDVTFPVAWLGKSSTKANLVLEGGAMRGLFTAGVTDFLLSKDIFCERVIGTSAGALMGYNYVAGLTGRGAYVNMKYCNDWRYLSLRSFALTGNAFGREMSFDAVPNYIDPFPYSTFDASPMSLIAVSSNLETGLADYHLFTDAKADVPYLISSSAMPMVSQIVEIDGKKLLDGGPCDSIPIEFSLETGAQKHIVVLTQDATYHKDPNKMMPVLARRFADYPNFVERLEGRFVEYNAVRRRLFEMHEAGQVFVLMPEKPVTIATMEHNQQKLLDLYEEGVAVAASQFDALQAYLNAPTPEQSWMK